jgi:hypothetical protein
VRAEPRTPRRVPLRFEVLFMLRGSRWMLCSLTLCAMASPAGAIVVQPLSPTGTYLRAGAPSFQIGSGGFVEEIDAFVLPAGAAAPTQLGAGAAPADLALAFSASLSADGTDLLLAYEFTNSGASPLAELTFLSYFDGEIDETLNTFFNEFATTSGALAAGQDYEVDEPGYVFGDIFANAQAGALDGTNALPAGSPDDVAMSLSFAIGLLSPGQTARFEILLSEDGDTLGGFAIHQTDVDVRSTTVITYSGAAFVVPEPATALLLGAGLALVASRRRN